MWMQIFLFFSPFSLSFLVALVKQKSWLQWHTSITKPPWKQHVLDCEVWMVIELRKVARTLSWKKKKKERKYVTFSAQWFPRAICVTGWEEAKSVWEENTLGGRLASLHCHSGSLCDPWLSLFYHFFFSPSFFFFFSVSLPPLLNGKPVHPSESCFTPIPQWDPYLFSPLQTPRDPEKKKRDRREEKDWHSNAILSSLLG